MSTPANPSPAQDPHVLAQEELATLAFGEPVDAVTGAHVENCPQCREEVAALRQVIAAARAADRGSAPAPPSSRVWEGVLAALGEEAPETAAPWSRQAPSGTQSAVVAGESGAKATITALSPRPGERPSRRWLRPLLAAAAAVVLLAAGTVGWALGRSSDANTATRSSVAVLTSQPGTPAAVVGRAVVHNSPDGDTLQVNTSNMPAPVGYYEVWLYNPSINQMVAVGTLGTGARGTFTVPSGIDLNAYHVVDVSAQRYDGNNAHERSVLRGSLAR